MDFLSTLGLMAIFYCIGLLIHRYTYFHYNDPKDNSPLSTILDFIFVSCLFLSFPITCIGFFHSSVYVDTGKKQEREDQQPYIDCLESQIQSLRDKYNY